MPRDSECEVLRAISSLPLAEQLAGSAHSVCIQKGTLTRANLIKSSPEVDTGLRAHVHHLRPRHW